MYGAKLFGVYAESPGGLSYALGKNSEVFTKGDFVSKASGVLLVASSGALEGICDRSVTMASDNQTVAKVMIPYYSSRMDFTFEADFDGVSGATNTVANQEKFYTITGTTGAQQIANGSGSTTSGQVCFMQGDPRGTGDGFRGMFRFAKAQSESWTAA